MTLSPVLFLDFDGVLHPDAVYRSKRDGIVLRANGSLFEWVDLLQPALIAAPRTQVVLSTSWVKALGFGKAKSYLAPWLQARVIGGTWHQRDAVNDEWGNSWSAISRYEQIAAYVTRRAISHWVALDDNDEEWPDKARPNLVKTDSNLGLAERGKPDELLASLVANEKSWFGRFTGVTQP